MGTSRDSATFDPYVARMIHETARKLNRHNGWTADDLPDIEQELRSHLWQRSPRFNPARSSWPTFANRVLANKARTMLRDSRTAKRSPSRLSRSLNEEVDDGEGGTAELQDVLDAETYLALTGRSGPSDFERADLRTDMERLLAELSPREIVICHLIAAMSKNEAAAVLGIHRSTLHREVQRLRDRFRDAGLDDYLV